MFRPLGFRVHKKLYMYNGWLCTLSAFVPALVQLCEAFMFCVFSDAHFLELAVPWPVIEFHWPSTIMMKWRPVMLAPLISVTLVSHMSTAVRGSDMCVLWPLRDLPRHGGHAGRAAQNIFSSSNVILLSVYTTYILKSLYLIPIKHVSELTRPLELTIWSDLTPGAHRLSSAATDVLERENLLIAQFK